MFAYVMTICLLAVVPLSVNGGSPDRVKLRDLEVVTLHSGHYTSGRRSSPVPQLKCVGGTAGCTAYVPPVVQCYNRGSDGYDVQWECKADMDNEYRFGQIAVNCEGYDYPDDPYILRGSCGLEYTLDLTKGGHQRASSFKQYDNYQSEKPAGSIVSVIIFIIGMIVVWKVFSMCSSRRNVTHDDPPPYPGYGIPPTAPPPQQDAYGAPPPYAGSTAPPAPGFRSDYMPHSAQDGCSSAPFSEHTPGWQQPRQGPSAGLGEGFLNGAMTGGVLGYLFGSRGQTHQPSYVHSSPQYHPTNTWWSSSNTNSDSTWTSPNRTSSSTSSSGTRTTSGFGGTKRR